MFATATLDDTIVAIASAPGGAARGIVRLSGPDVSACLERCFMGADGTLPSQIPRGRLTAGHVRVDDETTAPATLYYWPTSASYTGQPAAELHAIGSPPLLNAMIAACCAAGARLARPGEFTMRAFLSGRLDLTEAEAVLGVIDADDEPALRTALGQLAGGLARPLAAIRDELLDLLADVEAGLDFADEDIQFIAADELRSRLDGAARGLATIADRLSARGSLAAETTIVLLGAPNAGKSSLMNALAGESISIVDPQPGATRDYVTARLVLDGVPCRVIDTAGIGAAPTSRIDAEAQQATAAQQAQARMVIWCVDATTLDYAAPVRFADADFIVVATKVDLCGARDGMLGGALFTSSRTGEGIAELRTTLKDRILRTTRRSGDCVLSTAARCETSLRRAEEDLARARAVVGPAEGALAAAEIRGALAALGEVAGAVYSEDVLDRIFSRFCIGK